MTFEDAAKVLAIEVDETIRYEYYLRREHAALIASAMFKATGKNYQIKQDEDRWWVYQVM